MAPSETEPSETEPSKEEALRRAVREEYGKTAEAGDTGCGCSGGSWCGPAAIGAKAVSKGLGYTDSELNRVPEGANMGLGCGSPKDFAALKAGETVLDLGSGGGFDCFLAAEEVGETGRVVGVDMTPEMVTKARALAEKAGRTNVDFRLGEIENLPAADGSADVVISNCVINLSPAKARVFHEVYRVLKPGGRLAVSDIVALDELPDHLKNDTALWTGCMAGASTIPEIKAMLNQAGFEDVTITPKDGSREFLRDWAPDSRIEDYLASAAIRALKPRG